MMRLGIKKKMVVITVATITVIGGSLAAYAYFTSTGSGSGSATTGSATNWTVGNVSTSGTMYPGAGTSTLTYRVTNPGTGQQGVTAVAVTVAADGSGNILEGSTAIPGCLASWFTPAASTFLASNGTTVVTLPADLAGSDYITGSSAVTLTNAAVAQDACQGRSPKLNISVS